MISSNLLLPALGGLRLIESAQMVDGPFEDWSDVRAPSRAARRRKMGHKQRIRFFYKPKPSFLKLPDGTLVGHPETVSRLRAAIPTPNGGGHD